MRAEQIEDIIIGSLLVDFNEYWPSVRNCIPPDIISERNRPIYEAILAIDKRKEKVDIVTVFKEIGMCEWDGLQLIDLSNECFAIKKAEYNERSFITGSGTYTNVSFDDYVSKYIEYRYGE